MRPTLCISTVLSLCLLGATARASDPQTLEIHYSGTFTLTSGDDWAGIDGGQFLWKAVFEADATPCVDNQSCCDEFCCEITLTISGSPGADGVHVPDSGVIAQDGLNDQLLVQWPGFTVNGYPLRPGLLDVTPGLYPSAASSNTIVPISTADVTNFDQWETLFIDFPIVETGYYSVSDPVVTSVLPPPPGLVAWGLNTLGQTDVPALPEGVCFVDFDGGGDHSLGLLDDGTVLAWGSSSDGKTTVPAAPAGLEYVEVGAGDDHSAARLSDGTVVTWGDTSTGSQTSQPALPAGVTNVEISAGNYHTMARRSDGSVVAWGQNGVGQLDVPPPPAGLSYVEIFAGGLHSVARLSDGSVVVWGANWQGQHNVPALPDGLSYVQISAGTNHTLGLRIDGSVVAWGDNSAGQTNVPALPTGLSYVEVSANGYSSLARRSDGSVVGWGQGASGQTTAPALPEGLSYARIEGGRYYSLALTAPTDTTWVDLGNALGGALGEPSLVGSGPLTEGSINPLVLTNAQPSTGTYLVVGLSDLYAPIKGGVLVPEPDLLFDGIPTNASGTWILGSPWPADVPSGFEFYWQTWIPDASGPKGFTASNATRSTTP
jgi:hypothetical protein